MEFLNYWDTSVFFEPRFYVGTLIFAAIAYLIGSINAGQILSILGSKDLGQEGSRNFGATNAGRVYGAKGFAAVFLFDMLKSVFTAIILTIILTRGTFKPVEEEYFFAYSSISLAMVWVVIGHSFPIFFGFKGGKGVASVFGCVLVLNWVFALCAIIVFGATIGITRWTAWGSIIGTIFGVILVVFAQESFFETAPYLLFFWSNTWLNIFSALFLGVFITFRHRSNIIRMIQGKDPFFKPKDWVKPTETKEEES